MKDSQELPAMLQKLKSDNLLSQEHPFFNEYSPFYLSNDDTVIKPVTAEIDGKHPSWDASDNVQLISL